MKETMFQTESESRKRLVSQFEGSQKGRILFYSGKDQTFCSIQAIDWMWSTHTGEGDLLNSVSLWMWLMLTSSKNTLTGAPEQCLFKYLGTLWPSQVDA